MLDDAQGAVVVTSRSQRPTHRSNMTGAGSFLLSALSCSPVNSRPLVRPKSGNQPRNCLRIAARRAQPVRICVQCDHYRGSHTIIGIIVECVHPERSWRTSQHGEVHSCLSQASPRSLASTCIDKWSVLHNTVCFPEDYVVMYSITSSQYCAVRCAK